MLRKCFIILAFLPLYAAAQNGPVQGFCTQGGISATVSGLGSSNKLQGIIPGCTITVYLTGTTNLATLHTSTGGSLSNPFTANLSSSTNPGGWIFYAATGQGYDVTGKGGGGNPSCTTAPLCYTVATPLLVDAFSGGAAGGIVDVNGSTVSSPNFNGTTPAAPGGDTNCIWQVSGSSVSCYVPAGGTVGPGTVGYIPMFLTTTTIGNSHIDDGHTTPNILTATEQLTVTSPGCSGCAGWFLTTEGTDPTTQAGGGAGATIWTSDAAGNPMVNAHGTGLDYVCTALDLDGECPSSGGPTIQTNSSNNSSQSVLNFETSSTNAVGLTVTPHNTSGGIEKMEVTGGSYTGNAATATNLSSYPTLCTGGQFSQGLSSGSNNCATPSGGGGGGGLTPFSGSVTGSASQSVTLVASASSSQYNVCAGMAINSGSSSAFNALVKWTENSSTVSATIPNSASATSSSPDSCVVVNPDSTTAVTLQITQAGTPGTGVYWGNIGTTGGGTSSAKPPFMQIGSTLYLPQDGMYAVTLPPSSPVWINSVAPGTIINGTNGDILYAQSGTSTFYWEIESGTASVESVFQCLPTASTGSTGACGVYLYDVTNSLLYTEIEVGAGSSAPSVQIDSYSYTGSGNPSSGVNIATLASAFNGWASFAHMKIVKSGSSLLFQISPNGGGNFLTIYTQTGVGTISAGGVGLFTGTPMAMEVASEVVQ